jgi:hypothetical protein
MFFSIFYLKKHVKEGFLATSKSKHKRKQHQFHLRAKRKQDKRKVKIAPAAPVANDPPKT